VNFTEDIGRAIALLGERREAAGGVWHLPSDEPLTGRRFIELVGQAIGHPLRPSVTGPGTVRLAGLFVPMVREIGDVMYQWMEPFVSDGSRFERTFGPFEVTSNAEAISRTVDWYRERAARRE
jgi:nucleoside-diphosphate-sugar epimerase